MMSKEVMTGLLLLALGVPGLFAGCSKNQGDTDTATDTEQDTATSSIS